jgi:hypothetical protein
MIWLVGNEIIECRSSHGGGLRMCHLSFEGQDRGKSEKRNRTNTPKNGPD